MLYYNCVVLFIKHGILKKLMKSDTYWQFEWISLHFIYLVTAKKKIYTFVKKHLVADEIIKLLGECLLVTIDWLCKSNHTAVNTNLWPQIKVSLQKESSYDVFKSSNWFQLKFILYVFLAY